MKKHLGSVVLGIAAVCLCIGAVVAFSLHEAQRENEKVQIANPFQDDLTPKQAEEITGFTFALPEKYNGYTRNNLRASSALIEGIYVKKDDQVTVRKGKGKDISGDYNRYEKSEIVLVDQLQVIARGNADGFFTAIWSNKKTGYAFSIAFTSPVNEEELSGWVRQLN